MPSHPSLTAARQQLDDVLERHPAPWHVGDRPTPRSMWPVRDAQDRIVGYFPGSNRDVAQLVVDLRESV